jgi:hypothetical protein
VNVYTSNLNDAINKIDLLGKTSGDLAAKLLGMRVPKAHGLTAGGVLALKIPFSEIRGIISGASSAAIFFPDTCEVAAFSVTAGTADAYRRDYWDNENEFNSEEEKHGEWHEGGALVSMGASGELAYWIGPGKASAASFEGEFHTVQAAFSVPFTPIGMGASVYWGDYSEKFGGIWFFGGTVGFGPGEGVAFIDWDYQIMAGPINLEKKYGFKGKCVCYALTAAMP